MSFTLDLNQRELTVRQIVRRINRAVNEILKVV